MALLPRAIADKIQRMLTTDDKQTSGYDTTVGKLMAVGAFGLGSEDAAPVSTDFNNYTESGWYRWGGGGISNPPPAGSYGMMMVHSYAPQYCSQIFFGLSGDSEVWTRKKVTDVWSAWRRVYSQGTILGTVSQSGGVPGGAIIEQGSNANGYYTKFADGTLICHGIVALGGIALQTVWNSMFRSSSLIYNFPATFVGTPTCTGVLLWTDVDSTSASGVLNYSITTNSSRFMLVHPVSIATSGSRTVHYQVIGRWF